MGGEVRRKVGLEKAMEGICLLGTAQGMSRV